MAFNEIMDLDQILGSGDEYEGVGANPDGSVSDQEKEFDDDVLVVPNRKMKENAPVWQCGGIKLSSNKQKCSLCSKIFTSKTANSSNIRDHILRVHSNTEEAKRLKILTEEKRVKEKEKEMEKFKQKQQMASKQNLMLSYVRRSTPIDQKKKEKIDKALVKFITTEKLPFELVEKHAFREFVAQLEPDYIMPSRTTVTRKFDEFSEKIKEDFKSEIAEDLKNVRDKVINITSDHGTSHDKLESHKNALTISRCDKNFVIKTDTVALINCEGSQTGSVIRRDIKNKIEELGINVSEVVINWTTDGEAKQVSARSRGRHPAVGMETFHTSSCVDHTAHLAAESSLNLCPEIKASVDKCRRFVNVVKDSNLKKEAFYNVMKEQGQEPLSIRRGTTNRWYFKLCEVERILLLKPYVQQYQEEADADETEVLSNRDFHNMTLYVNSLKTLSTVSELMEGDTYNTASNVIPFLDQVFSELETLVSKLPEHDKKFPKALLETLKSNERFPNGYKCRSPFNSLTLTNPKYMDIYFNSYEVDQAIKDISEDQIFVNEAMEVIEESNEPSDPLITGQNQQLSAFAKRRASLLAQKQQQQPQSPNLGNDAVNQIMLDRVTAEFGRFVLYREKVVCNINPQK